MTDLHLYGCRPTPLASYLKGLAVLRLLASTPGGDPACRARWEDGHLVLATRLDREALLDFFLDAYRPTPILSPWNGGSGFYPGDRQEAVTALAGSSDGRLAPYREALAAARRAVARLGLKSKPDEQQKGELLALCRATFPEEALLWLDAAVVLTASGRRFTPLLGTGGNDGRLEFSYNFMLQLLECLPPPTGTHPPEIRRANLSQSLLADADRPVAYSRASLGQFHPGGAGGLNSGQGFEGGAVANPWDYVLAMEGACCFAGAVARRLGARAGSGQAAFPFTVDGAPVGHGSLSAAEAKGIRAEIWLPEWVRPATWPEVAHLLAEGRAQWGRRQAATTVDIARAAVGLGVDRGLSAFHRTGLLLRNGRSYLAVPLGRLAVRPHAAGRLLRDPALEEWLERLRRAAAVHAPSARALNRVEEAILAACEREGPDRLQAVLIAAGQAEQAAAASPKTAEKLRLLPLGGLDPRWAEAAADHSPEWRLALALAGIQGHGGVGAMRTHLEPVRREGDLWRWQAESRSPGWHGPAPLSASLAAILHRRCLEADRARLESLPIYSPRPALLGDVASFLAGELDERRIARLLPGLACLRWEKVPWQSPALGQPGAGDGRPPGAATLPRPYALLKLLFWPGPLRDRQGRPLLRESGRPLALRPDRGVLTRLQGGDVAGAADLALRQLQGARVVPRLPAGRHDWFLPAAAVERLAAALLIPVAAQERLLNWILRPGNDVAKEEELA